MPDLNSYSVRKYSALLYSSLLMAAALFANSNIVQMVAGRRLGQAALAATAVIFPYSLLPNVLTVMVASGTVILFSQGIGRGDRDSVKSLFSQGLFTMLLLGLAFMACFLIFEDSYLDFMHLEGEVRNQALAFGRGFLFAALPIMLLNYLNQTVYGDGGGRLCLIGSFVFLFLQISFSLILSGPFGMTGLALSMILAMLGNIAVLSLHFRKDYCNLGLKASFSLKSLARVASLGLGEMIPKGGVLLLALLVSNLASSRFGALGLEVQAVINGIGSLSLLLQSPSQAALPLGAVYYGERNFPGLKRVMGLGVLGVVIVGLVLGLFQIFFAPFIAGLFGIREGESLIRACQAIRILGIFLLPRGLAFLFGTYFRLLGKAALASSYMFALTILAPLAAICFVSWNFGIVGLSFCNPGQTAFFLACLVPAYLICRRKKLTFPLFLPKDANEEKELFLSLLATPDAISEAVAKVRSALSCLKPGDQRATRAPLGLEELLQAIMLSSQGRKAHLEVLLDYPGEDLVRIVVRDDGKALVCQDSHEEIGSPQNLLHNLSLNGMGLDSGSVTGSHRHILLFKPFS